jgi:hypothetical protein
MNKLVSSVVDAFVGFANKSLIKNLIIITLCICLVFLQVFFPYQHFAQAENQNSDFKVGIHYVFEQDNLTQISGEVVRIHDLGFKVIRITLECNPEDYNDTMNLKADEFFSATDSAGLEVALVVQNACPIEKIDYYLDRWGSHLSYIQVLNEPELSQSWTVGSLFTDDELTSKFDLMYQTVTAHNLPVQYYTNFGIGYVLRINVPMELSSKLDFVGLDIFMDSFLVLSPHFINNLHQITGKDVVITEFGMSTGDSQAQTDFIIKGLTLFKNMGLKGCWLVYWNSDFDNYGIRDRPTMTAVGDWIAQNAN